MSPATVTPSGAAAVTSTLTVQTHVAAMSARRTSVFGGENDATVGLSGVVLLGWTLMRKRRRGKFIVQLALALVLLATGSMTGCGGSGVAANKTPPGAYTLTVTGTSGAMTVTASYSLTVK
jgi:hypothetical protein